MIYDYFKINMSTVRVSKLEHRDGNGCFENNNNKSVFKYSVILEITKEALTLPGE